MCGTSGSPRDTPKYELLHGMQVTERRIGYESYVRGYESYCLTDVDDSDPMVGRNDAVASPFSLGAVM